jgi:hypothetical protein
MKKYNNRTSLEVSYVLISRSSERLEWSSDDVAIGDYFHSQGYKAHVEGNILVIAKTYPWGECRLEYVIVPNFDGLTYHSSNATAKYGRAMRAAENFAMAHTVRIVRRVNAGF